MMSTLYRPNFFIVTLIGYKLSVKDANASGQKTTTPTLLPALGKNYETRERKKLNTRLLLFSQHEQPELCWQHRESYEESLLMLLCGN